MLVAVERQPTRSPCGSDGGAAGCFAGGAAAEEEGADSCRGEGKLSAAAVEVTEEGAATSVAAGRRWRKVDCCWPVKKLEGGGAPVEAVAAEEAAGGVAGAVEAAVKEKLLKFCRWLCVDERERGQCWGCWQRMRGKGEGCPGVARGGCPLLLAAGGKRKSSRLGERRGR